MTADEVVRARQLLTAREVLKGHEGPWVDAVVLADTPGAFRLDYSREGDRYWRRIAETTEGYKRDLEGMVKAEVETILEEIEAELKGLGVEI